MIVFKSKHIPQCTTVLCSCGWPKKSCAGASANTIICLPASRLQLLLLLYETKPHELRTERLPLVGAPPRGACTASLPLQGDLWTWR